MTRMSVGHLRGAAMKSREMKTDTLTPKTIDAYITSFPKDVHDILQKIRGIIKDAAPEAEEAIKYQIPTFVLNGNLVPFAAFQKHIGFYPTPSGIEKFRDALSAYNSAKGSVQFPPDSPIPVRAALDSLAEGLLVLDRKGRIVLANQAFSEWVGIPSEKLTGTEAASFGWIMHGTNATGSRLRRISHQADSDGRSDQRTERLVTEESGRCRPSTESGFHSSGRSDGIDTAGKARNTL